MNTTKVHEITAKTVLINTSELMEVLHSGRHAAVTIGENAEARVQVGKRVFWNFEKIKKYIDTISL